MPAFRDSPVERGKLDAVLEAGRYLPLPGPVACRAVVIEAPPMRAALLSGLAPLLAESSLGDGLRSAPVLVALCDAGSEGSGAAAALIAASQMALVAEEEGLAAVLLPAGGAVIDRDDLPLPRGTRIQALLALGRAAPGDRAVGEPPGRRGVESYLTASPPPQVARSGEIDQDVLTSFMEIASASASADDLDEMMIVVARALGRLFPVDGAGLGLREEGVIVVREIVRRGEAVRREPNRLPDDRSHLMGFVIESGRPLWRNDVPSEVRFTESLPATGMRSDMVIPLRARGRIIGAFGVGCRRRHAFDPADFEVLQRCADLMAVAVETQRLLARTKKLAELDGVTGVPNHRHFLDLLDQEVEAARRGDRPLAVLMIDIDDFKRFNDTHGHQAGDEVLRHVAQAAAKLLRRSDVVARYGGEEFAAILPDSNLEGALTAAETIRAGLEKSPLTVASAARPLQVRVSVGAACMPDDAESPAGLVAAADRGLYQAKRTGKNRVCHLPRARLPPQGTGG